MRQRLSLSGQLLLLQLAIVLLVVGAVAAVSIAEADAAFRRVEGERLRSVGENAAINRTVRLGLGNPLGRDALETVAESVRAVSGASYVVVTDAAGTIVTGPDAGREAPLGASTGLTGRSWVGVLGDREALVAHVPVLDEQDGHFLGLIIVGRTYPRLVDQLGSALTNLLTYLVLGAALGVGGSLLLARRVKRQTLGMEPREITGLVEHREAMLLNRQPVVMRGHPVGSVTTLRDRTELTALRRELDVSRHTTDTLRAQAHEFVNRLHTIAGLVELGEHAEVVRYITRTSELHESLDREVTRVIRDPALAALLIAKASLAAEQGVALTIGDGTDLPPVGDRLSADLVTVVGNLVDNAFDAVGPGGTIAVTVAGADAEVVVTVTDSGPGVDPGLAERVFQQGYSTKDETAGHHGLGLAMIRLICVHRGGSVTVGGSRFTARLPFEIGVP